MISFNYFCNWCGDKETSQTLESFICECGGEFKVEHQVYSSVFQPYYSREMKTFITSPKHEDRELRRRGFAFLHDHKSLKQEAANIRKHKIDHVREKYKEIGVKFKATDIGKKFDEKKGEFIAAIVIGLLLITTPSFARDKRFRDVEYTNLIIKGVEYQVPIANNNRKNDLYFLKKALSGDKDAREIFLGGLDKRYFPIGDTKVIWLVVDQETEYILTP